MNNSKGANSVTPLFLVLLLLNSAYGPSLLCFTGILPDKPAVTVKFTVTFQAVSLSRDFFICTVGSTVLVSVVPVQTLHKYEARVGLFKHFMHLILCRLGWAEPQFQGNDYLS